MVITKNRPGGLNGWRSQSICSDRVFGNYTDHGFKTLMVGGSIPAPRLPTSSQSQKFTKMDSLELVSGPAQVYAIAVILRDDLVSFFILLDRFLKLNKIRTFVFVHDA